MVINHLLTGMILQVMGWGIYNLAILNSFLDSFKKGNCVAETNQWDASPSNTAIWFGENLLWGTFSGTYASFASKKSQIQGFSPLGCVEPRTMVRNTCVVATPYSSIPSWRRFESSIDSVQKLRVKQLNCNNNNNNSCSSNNKFLRSSPQKICTPWSRFWTSPMWSSAIPGVGGWNDTKHLRHTGQGS